MTITCEGTGRVVQPGRDTVHYHEAGRDPCRLLIHGSGCGDPVQGGPTMAAL